MARMDRLHTAHPYYGSRKLAEVLSTPETPVNRKRVQRLMRVMGLEALYCRPKTTVTGRCHRVYPHLLQGVPITRVGQVWSADITYLPMPSGFLYLVAAIDWYSRHVVSWRLSNTLDGWFRDEMLEEALSRGTPSVFNTDQGVQFTARAWTDRLEEAGVSVSMVGRGRCLDNVFVERLWRSVKTDPTATASRRRRCPGGYNSGARVSVGVAGVGPFLPGVLHPHRRSRTVSDRPVPIPPRA